MFEVFLQTIYIDVISLDNECPHNLRIIMYLMRTLEGHKHMFVHSTTGLGVKSLLELIRSHDHSMFLMNVAYNLLLMKNLYFPCIYDAAELFTTLRNDVIVLFRYEPSK